MQAFRNLLDADDIAAVADFVMTAFVRGNYRNTRYHTAENGWPEHDARYGTAYPFVLGRILVDSPQDRLTASERGGLKLFRESCIICHDHTTPIASTANKAASHSAETDGGHEHSEDADAYSDKTRPPKLSDPTSVEIRGMRLYQKNCSQCHALDGTGGNWIGQFLQPNPTDFTSSDYKRRFSEADFHRLTEQGIIGASMPAFGSVLGKNEIEAIIAYMKRDFLLH